MIYSASVEANRLMSSYGSGIWYAWLQQQLLHNYHYTLGVSAELLLVRSYQRVQPL